MKRAGRAPIHNSRGASNGSVVAHYDYAPFGAVIAQSGALADANPFGFSSEYDDRDLGLVYYNYRHYDPVTGRWTSRDPIGEEGGLGLYGFVGNNVEAFVDIMGESSCNCGRDLVYIADNPDYKEKGEKDALDYARENIGKRSFLGKIFGIKPVNYPIHSPEEFKPNSNLKDGECVCNLLVIAHGTSNKGEGWVRGKFGAKDSHRRRESQDEHGISNMFEGIRFCPNCTLELRVCNLGNSDVLQERLESISGCKVKLYDSLVGWNGSTSSK